MSRLCRMPVLRAIQTLVGAASLLLPAPFWAGSIPVPNGSFETPATIFVAVDFDSWQEAPKPSWFVETADDKWTYKVGTFLNTNATSPDHIDNMNGSYALFLFSVPDVALFQDFDTVDFNDPATTHAFNAVYEPGKFYDLTVGLCGLSGGMPEGATLDLSLYYRDASGNHVPVAKTTVIHSFDVFTSHTHFLDFHVRVPVVQPTDAWAGKHIGIEFKPTVDHDGEGGYWDIDNVRLFSGPDPLVITRENNDARLAWKTIPGYQYQLQSSDNLVDWTNEGLPAPGTGGTISQLYPIASNPRRLFRAVISALP